LGGLRAGVERVRVRMAGYVTYATCFVLSGSTLHLTLGSFVARADIVKFVRPMYPNIYMEETPPEGKVATAARGASFVW
jgi:hypothetical protein